MSETVAARNLAKWLITNSERLLFRFVKRDRESRKFQTNFDDDFIKTALACQYSPRKFYSTSPVAESDDFLSIGLSSCKNVSIQTLQFSPRFYHPTRIDETEYCDSERLEAKLYVRKGSLRKTALILINAWGVKESTNSDHKLAVKLAERFDISTFRITLPFHRERAPKSFESGELALNGDAIYCSPLVDAVV